MQKNIVKAVCIFTLVFFVMSMTGAAACSGACTSCKTCTSTSCKMDAKNDKFTVDTCKKTYCFNVLKNDKGCTKVVPGTFTTAKGGKVVMRSNGVFCYTQPVSSFRK